MASWPTTAQIQTYFQKFVGIAEVTNRVTRSRARAIQRILSKQSVKYLVKDWIDGSVVVPPALAELCYWLTYGYAGLAAHVGQGQSGSDTTARDALKDTLDELQSYADGSADLLDDAGDVVAKRTFATGVPRVKEPVFGMKDPINWRIRDDLDIDLYPPLDS